MKMNIQTLRVANLDISAVKSSAQRICFVLSPFVGLEPWAAATARSLNVSIVLITGMDWDNSLTPWPAKGQPPGSPDFKGDAREFLSTLVAELIPAVESRMGMSPDVERTLTGVSLSGLFTLWQWMLCDTFRNIISISGSFWYEGFAEWLMTQPVPKKTGKACFLLGNQEAKTNVKAFRPVQTDTEKIVAFLREKGIDVVFELVPGNHYQYGVQRLTHAFTLMFGPDSD